MEGLCGSREQEQGHGAYPMLVLFFFNMTFFQSTAMYQFRRWLSLAFFLPLW